MYLPHLPIRYPLLLRELLHATEENAVGREALEEALDMIRDMALRINELKRRNEEIDYIQTHLTGVQSVADLGTVLRFADMQVSEQNSRKAAPRRVVLFSKALVICKERHGGDLVAKHNLKIDQITVDMLPNDNLYFAVRRVQTKVTNTYIHTRARARTHPPLPQSLGCMGQYSPSPTLLTAGLVSIPLRIDRRQRGLDRCHQRRDGARLQPGCCAGRASSAHHLRAGGPCSRPGRRCGPSVGRARDRRDEAPRRSAPGGDEQRPPSGGACRRLGPARAAIRGQSQGQRGRETRSSQAPPLRSAQGQLGSRDPGCRGDRGAPPRR